MIYPDLECVTGNVASGKTRYLIDKAKHYAAKAKDNKIAIITPYRGAAQKLKKSVAEYQNIHALTCMDIALQAKQYLVGSQWGHEYPTTWVSPHRLINVAKQLFKSAYIPKAYAEKTVWFIVASERNLWADDEMREHLFLWFGAHDKYALDVINNIYDFMAFNNVSLYPMAFNALRKALNGYESVLGYTHIMIDDAQMLPLCEYRFVESLATGKRSFLTITADNNKMVRSWSEGAYIDIKADFLSKHPTAIETVLDKRYGVSWQIGDILDHIKSLGAKHIPHDTPKLKLFRVDHERTEAQSIINQVKVVRQRHPGKTLLITFRTPWFGKAIVNEALKTGLNADIRGVGQEQIVECFSIIADYLCLAANPLNGIAFTNIVNKPSRRLGQTVLDNLNALRMDRKCESWVELVEMAYEVHGFGKSQIEKLQEIKSHAEALGVLEYDDIYAYIIEDIGLGEYLKAQYNEYCLPAIKALRQAAKNSVSASECLRRYELLQAGAYDKDCDVVIAPASAVVGERFDYVWVAGVEDGVFPLKIDTSSYWDTSSKKRDYNALYTVLSRANRGVVLWSSYIRNIGGYWKKTALSSMISNIVDMDEAFNTPKQKSRPNP